MKLSERVEQATGDDYSLRVEIAEALGWTKNPVGGVIAWYAPEEPGIMKAGPPKWLTSLDAAMTLVPEGFVLHNLQETPTIVHEEHTGWEPLPNWQATLLRQDCAGYRNRKKFMQAFEHGGGNTAALALCAAALKARGVRWAKYVPDLCRQDRQRVSNKGR